MLDAKHYLPIYLQAEKMLARLKWPGKIDDSNADKLRIIDAIIDNQKFYSPVPQWIRSEGAIFPLMVELGCYPIEKQDFITVDCDRLGIRPFRIQIADHPTKELAVKYTILLGAILVLQAQAAQ